MYTTNASQNCVMIKNICSQDRNLVYDMDMPISPCKLWKVVHLTILCTLKVMTNYVSNIFKVAIYQGRILEKMYGEVGWFLGKVLLDLSDWTASEHSLC